MNTKAQEVRETAPTIMFEVMDMKRMLAVVCGLWLCAAGCGMGQLPGKTENRMDGGFTADVTVTSADSEICGTLTRYGTNAWCVTFTEPPALAGVALDFTDEEVKASYKGLAFSVPQSAQAIRTELSGLMETVDSLALSPELDGTSKDGLIVCEGEGSCGAYTLTCAEDGTPLTYALPSYGVTVTFDSFTAQDTSPATETVPKTYPAPDAPTDAPSDAPTEAAT